MSFGPRVLSTAIAVAVLLSTAPQAAHAAAAKPKPTRVKVSVTGLPPGVKASVKVRGPGYAKTLTRSTTLTVPKAGTFTFTVRQVKIRTGRKKVKSGSIALPAVKTVKVTLKRGATGRAKLAYGTIINANVKGLSFAKTAFTGDPLDPKTLTLPASTRVKPGAILTGKPTDKLPAGVFHRVTKVKRVKHTLVVTVTPAHLQEAFPQLDISTKLNIEPDKTTVTAGASGRTSAFDPLVASLGTPNFRCSFSLADSYIKTSASLGLDGKVEIHIPTTWGIPTGIPYGELGLTLHGDASLDILLRKNSGCTGQVALPPIPGSIPVGPVLVPTYVQFGLFATASLGEDIRQHAAAGFSLTAGMAFKGTKVTNTSKASAYAEASASGAGKFAFGPSIRLAVGAAGLADVHFDAKPAVAFSVALDASCSIDIEGGSQVGISFGPFQINQPLPAPKINLYRCPPGGSPAPVPTTTPVPQPVTRPALELTHTGPLGAFQNQTFGYAIRVKNTGDGVAKDVEVVDTLPNAGTLVDSDPAGTPAAAGPNDRYVIAVGDLQPGEDKTVTVRWKAPDDETSLTNQAFARAANADATDSQSASVPIGTTANCNPCGAEAGGTGLRNRDHGAIAINGIPAGATVGRAVLVWGILYNGEVPADAITFQGHKVRADIAANVSGNLCWDDDNTIGYAADVTPYVTGNGTYDVTDPVRGATQIDGEPHGTRPYTDGATLVVFYVGGGAQNQVLSDFTYDTNTDADGGIHRSFGGINSVGGAASLILAGPDGQSNAGETFTLTGADTLTLNDTFDGSDPQDGPAFEIGSLWDTDRHDVSAILPAGQETLAIDHLSGGDCIGVGATVLQVSQRPAR